MGLHVLASQRAANMLQAQGMGYVNVDWLGTLALWGVPEPTNLAVDPVPHAKRDTPCKGAEYEGSGSFSD